MAKPDRIAPLIPWYVNGTLGAEDRKRIEQHLSECANCRELEAQARTAMRIGRSAARDTLLDHVHAQLLDDWVGSPGSLDEGTRAWLERHLETCDNCAEESRILVQVRRLQSEGEGSGVSALSSLAAKVNELLRGLISATLLAGRRPLLAAVISAGLMFVILGYPTYVGLFHLPAVTGQAERLRHELETLKVESTARVQSLGSEYERRITELEKKLSWSGPVDIALLLPASRSGERVQQVRISANQPHTLLGIQLDSERRIPAHGDCRVEILSGTGVVWTQQLSTDQIRKSVDSKQGVIVLLIPATILKPSEYSLRMLPPGGGAPLLEKKFEIVR